MHWSTSRGRTAVRTLAAAAIVAAVFLTSACATPAPPTEPGDANISLGILGVPPSLDPAYLDDGQSQYIWNGVFDTLVYLDTEGQLQPNAAESWEYSDDALDLTLHLRAGMTFSSGAPVDAEAVKATLDRTRAASSTPSSRLTAIESIEVVDDLSVKLHLSRPDGALLSNLAFGAGVIGDPATIEDEATALRPVGSGPYVIDDAATTNGATYVLTRRDDHWNAEAFPFKTVTIKVISDNAAAFNALQSGEISAASVQPDQVAVAEGAGFTTKTLNNTSLASLVLLDRAGELVPALGDARVRQAINMAFDREGLATNVLRGRGGVTQQIFYSGASGHVDALDSTYSFDVDGAKALLAEAGYPDGFSLTLPSTFLSTQLEPLVTQALGEIGIAAVWEPVPAQEVASSLAAKRYGAAFYITTISAQSRDLQTYFGPSGFLNPFNPSDAEFNVLYDATNAAITDDEIEASYQELNTYLVENAFSVPLFFAAQTWATAPGIEYLGNGGAYTTSVRLFGLSD
ncbi:hypothetical protein ASC66_04310 [Leifsonia sp. Root4]|uniref:ABC transporter substrate-binding protein n=1 Tax=Leifsonia sp. Root4 TaxID=1736525 RepID=UPI0006FB4A63|nr:ABC transporter substrate-binding protein [Leifsonia sp. Root4]KQW08162.1 hypothetical protein ASC66_04310 [Leifsonia sp. Root4]